MWISPEILNWKANGESFSAWDNDNIDKTYEMWAHAKDLLENYKGNKYQLVDAMVALKRTVDFRVRTLNESYSFKKIPIKDKPPGILELLAYFDVIRPLMLNSLTTIRNDLEHQYSNPPEIERCLEFLDFVWYFLRSTDYLVNNVLDRFILIPRTEPFLDYDYWLKIETNPEKEWCFRFGGRVEPQMLSKEDKGEWIKVDLEATETQK